VVDAERDYFSNRGVDVDVSVTPNGRFCLGLAEVDRKNILECNAFSFLR
jgi:hypothetical protein